MDKILVTYASRNGSTEGVANSIGKTLVLEGFHVDILPLKEVKDILTYRGVVLGSAIQSGQWLHEALDFVKENRSFLNETPFAIFSVCMTLAMPKADKYREFVSGWLEPIRLLVKPKSEANFAGMLDIKNIDSFSDRIKFRLSVMFGVWKEGDHRNWEEINEWAKGLKRFFD
ncbi:MAG: flavodoxin domain-containing protein [Tenuifilaceae bacterium]